MQSKAQELVGLCCPGVRLYYLSHAGTENAVGEENGAFHAKLCRTRMYESWCTQKDRCGHYGDTIEFLVELLESDGGIKGNLFQVDDIYENYYYIPTIESAKIQVKLLTDKEKQIGLYRFLCGILEQPGTREYQVSAGTDQTGNPVYFCYELELRHLLRVKQELGWKKQGTILCFSYQKSILEYYFGKEVSYLEILTEKVMEYLEGL